MQNSKHPYTTKHLKTSQPWLVSTMTLAVLAIGGGWAIDSYLNPAAVAPTTSPTASNPTPSATPTGKPDMTVSGDAIPYAYGVVQVEVVRTGGKISAVNLVQGTASAGRNQAFSPLEQQAVASQGSSFANISGATYTTAAFKKALDSAISKLS